MIERAREISILMLVLLISSFFYGIVKASPSQSNGLELLDWYYPSEVYLGELFSIGLNIYNNDSVGHNYTVIWHIAGYDFYSHGNIGAQEKINVTKAFTLHAWGTYNPWIELLQNGNRVTYDYKTISVVEVDLTFTYYISTFPLYVGDSFDVNITVKNGGNGQAYEASLYVRPLQEKGLTLRSLSPHIILNNLSSGKLEKIQLTFNSTEPGVYTVTCSIKYYDLRQVLHDETFNILIEISSREILDDFETIQDENKRLRGELQQLRQDILYITVILSTLIVSVGVINYLLIRRERQIVR